MKTNKNELEIKEIAKVYFLTLRKATDRHFSSGSLDTYSPFSKYYSDVEEAFSLLDQESKTIINNEFFFQDYKYWWMSIYTPSIFIKKKKKAIKAFLEVFHEIH